MADQSNKPPMQSLALARMIQQSNSPGAANANQFNQPGERSARHLTNSSQMGQAPGSASIRQSSAPRMPQSVEG